MESRIFIVMINIYILERNGIPFYVGKAKNAVRRQHKHYLTFGTDIKMEVIDIIEDKQWKFWEQYWICQFKAWGFELENKNNGGGGPTEWTLEQKQDINPERIEKIINHPTRGMHISETLKQRNHSKYYTEEVRQKMSEPQKGKPKPFTEEHIKNISKANLESKGKTVECYDLNNNFIGEFSCLRETKNWLVKEKSLSSPNIDKQIKDCCNGRQKTCHGYKFKYK
jgi:hypothetical protein